MRDAPEVDSYSRRMRVRPRPRNSAIFRSGWSATGGARTGESSPTSGRASTRTGPVHQIEFMQDLEHLITDEEG